MSFWEETESTAKQTNHQRFTQAVPSWSQRKIPLGNQPRAYHNEGAQPTTNAKYSAMNSQKTQHCQRWKQHQEAQEN